MGNEETTMEQVKEKLRGLADKFMEHYRNGEYAKAKVCYDTALTVSCFIGLTEQEKEELWGNRDKSIPGLFMEGVVNKVFLETAVKGTTKNVTQMSQTEFELRHAQRRGMGLYAKKYRMGQAHTLHGIRLFTNTPTRNLSIS